MSAAKFFNISSYKTASRCWLPVNHQLRQQVKTTKLSHSAASAQNAAHRRTATTAIRHYSSRQRCINFNAINDAHLVSNDGVLSSEETPTGASVSSASADELFEPTVFSSEEVHTAGPVNKK